MISKIFEIRSRGTMLILMATKLGSDDVAENYLIARCGFGKSKEQQENYIIVTNIDGSYIATTDPYKHDVNDVRKAHQYILKHFDELDEGAVIDLEYIAGETKKPKVAARIQDGGDW